MASLCRPRRNKDLAICLIFSPEFGFKILQTLTSFFQFFLQSVLINNSEKNLILAFGFRQIIS